MDSLQYRTKPTRRYLFNIVLLALFLVMMPSISTALDLKGQLISDLYIFERNGESHFRPYEKMVTDIYIWQNGTGKSLSVHTLFRWTTDLREKYNSDPQTYIYKACIKLTGFPERTNFTLGRQFTYNGVGSVLIDGIGVRYSPLNRLRLELFAGSSVSGLNPEKMRSISDFGVYGGQIYFRSSPALNLSLNWFRRRDYGDVTIHKIGLFGSLAVRQWTSNARLKYNIINYRLDEILTRIAYYATPWHFSGEFRWREPSVSGNSLFSLIEFYRYKEFRFNSSRYIRKRLAVTAQINTTHFNDDNSWSVSLGIRSGNYSVSWLHKFGYGGDSDGLNAYASASLSKKLEFFAGLYLSRYRVQEEQESRNDAYTSRLGLQWRPGNGYLIRAEGQYLKNAVDNNAIRIHIRVVKDFSLSYKTGKRKL